MIHVVAPALLAVGASGPAVNIDPNDITSQSFQPDDCFTVLEFRTDGFSYVNDGGGGAIATVQRNEFVTRGNPEDVWLERVIDSGSLSDDWGAGRVQVNATRRLSNFRDAAIDGNGTTSTTVTINAYNKAVGGKLLDSKQVLLAAEVSA